MERQMGKRTNLENKQMKTNKQTKICHSILLCMLYVPVVLLLHVHVGLLHVHPPHLLLIVGEVQVHVALLVLALSSPPLPVPLVSALYLCPPHLLRGKYFYQRSIFLLSR